MGEREEGRIPGSDKGANCVIEIYFFLCYVNNCRSQMEFLNIFLKW